jgi:hypothetical protein
MSSTTGSIVRGSIIGTLGKRWYWGKSLRGIRGKFVERTYENGGEMMEKRISSDEIGRNNGGVVQTNKNKKKR